MDLVHDGLVEVNIHQAKTHLSRLMQRVAEGEEVIIARAGEPVARLVRIQPRQATRPLGMDRGSVVVPDDFNDPLPPDLLAQFLGEEKDSKTSVRKKRSRRKRK
jgi:prevent-host-death family protein